MTHAEATYEALRRAEQEQRYYADAHAIHAWEGGCPSGAWECREARLAALARVEAAQEAYDRA